MNEGSEQDLKREISLAAIVLADVARNDPNKSFTCDPGSVRCSSEWRVLAVNSVADAKHENFE